MHAGKRISETLNAVLAEGAVVAVRLGPGPDVLDVCRALARGGLRALELTLTTPGAIKAIRTLSRDDRSIVVGGGTVLTPDDARRVAEVGGRFAFSPVFDPEVLDEAEKLGLLAVPGAATPAEILAAHRHGARLVKVFPSGALGGGDYLRAIRGPLPDIPLIPTSGPTADTIKSYFRAGAAAVGVGGREFFGPGFTPGSIEKTARRVRRAIERIKKSKN